jgi:hypothetical protein
MNKKETLFVFFIYYSYTLHAEEKETFAGFIFDKTGGKSELYRVGRWLTTSQGNLEESATESRQPSTRSHSPMVILPSRMGCGFL